MTKTLVNKIKFEGPKTHNEIVKQIRNDMNTGGNTVSVKTVIFIVTSFFSAKGIFSNVDKYDTVKELHIGKFTPGRGYLKIQDNKSIRKLRMAVAKKYIRSRRRLKYERYKLKLINRYNKWCKAREADNRPYLPMETYVKYNRNALEIMRKFAISKITKVNIDAELWRFDDKGHIITKIGSKKSRQHYAIINQQKKEQDIT